MVKQNSLDISDIWPWHIDLESYFRDI